MAGDQAAVVLDAGDALHHRHAQVSELGQNIGDEGVEQEQTEVHLHSRKQAQPQAIEQAEAHRRRHARQGALHRFVGADLWQQLPLAPAAAHEVRGHIGGKAFYDADEQQVHPAGEEAHLDHAAQLGAYQHPQEHISPAVFQVQLRLEHHHQHKHRDGNGQASFCYPRPVGDTPEGEECGGQQGKGEQGFIFHGIGCFGQLIQAEAA